jgi:Ti-type conjugative transfer relaxase TraA
MAIYHLSVKVISRGGGRCATAAAAYRAGELVHDRSAGQEFDYTRKAGVEHTEILAPDHAPQWVFDRSELWNRVEEAEVRRDAQLAREVEVALPIELDAESQVELVREFAREAFVSKGMVADVAIHRDNPENPHAHILLTTRSLDGDGFGKKERGWNAKAELHQWRSLWAETANQHLRERGLDIQIDHRSLEAQGLELTAGRKIGVSRDRQESPRLPDYVADRVLEQRAIAKENGDRIIAAPELALTALTHSLATFTHHDLARYLNTRTDGAEQFREAYLKVGASKELVGLGKDERGRERFTTKEMVSLERGLLDRGRSMGEREGHQVSARHQRQVLKDTGLSVEQARAFESLTRGKDLAAVIGLAGSGKSTLLEATRRAWEAEGYTVKGAALSGIAAENLEHASGIESRTIASRELAWSQGRESLSSRDVLVIDEAGLVGTRQLARVLEVADAARAKVVLIGDARQLQAIEAGAAFRGIVRETGSVELNEVRRQKKTWQREAVKSLALGDTAGALSAYESEGHVHAHETREAARGALLTAWAKDEGLHQSRLMLTATRAEAAHLNAAAREVEKSRGRLERGEIITTERGLKEFAVGDRVYFLRNERSLGVKNGSLGTLEAVYGGVLQVKLDGRDDRRVSVDTRFYRDLDHGYAATVYKAQGSTVDRTYILATPQFDRHTSYVGLSRHREATALYYAREDFGGEGISAEQAREHLTAVLSRERAKDLAHDYLDQSLEVPELEIEKTATRSMSMKERIAARERELLNAWGHGEGASGERGSASERVAAREKELAAGWEKSGREAKKSLEAAEIALARERERAQQREQQKELERQRGLAAERDRNGLKVTVEKTKSHEKGRGLERTRGRDYGCGR